METDWIRRPKQDDETALCEIIRKYTGYVYTILRNFSHGTLPQEDCSLPRKTQKTDTQNEKNAPEHHVQERFLLPINGI